MEVCLGGLVEVWVLLDAASGFWCPVKVKVEVLTVVEEPGFASAQI